MDMRPLAVLLLALSAAACGGPMTSPTSASTPTPTPSVSPPIAVRLAVSGPTTTGSPVTFTLDVTAQSEISTAQLYFGDGTQSDLGQLSKTGGTVTHLYQESGTFNVTLVVTDSARNTLAVTIPVHVLQA